MSVEFSKILENLKEKWAYLITAEINETECVIIFPFFKPNNENVKVYLTQKGNSVNVSVMLNNPPKTEPIGYGNCHFQKDSEVAGLYTATNCLPDINNVIINAVSLALVFS